MVTVSSEYRHLPTAEELPDSNEKPVDNELQNDIPNILLNLLREIWGERSDWFWGVDMCIYLEPNLDEPEKSRSIVPDGFLALGVPRYNGEGGRLSYVLWQEKVLPILVLEVISQKYNGEYDRKLEEYQGLGIMYYAIYNPLSGRRGLYKNHQSLEVYKLVDGKYELMPSVALLQEGGKMIWIPEIDLGIGCERSACGNWQREWVYWYDRQGLRYPTAQERAMQERQARLEAEAIAERETQRADQERFAKQQAEQGQQQAEQKAQRLAEKLKTMGIDPDQM
jgi:Uma2 family endonuclease